MAIELRAEVADLTTAPRSAFGSLSANSISAVAVLTLRIAESVSGKSTALARYSPISADSFSSFLRSSSIFLDVTSDVDVIAIVAVAVEVIFVVRLFKSTKLETM